MLRNFSLLIIALFCTTVAISQTTIQGKITKADDGETVPFAAVKLLKNDVFIAGSETDFDGNYSFSDIAPGTYDIEISELTLQNQRINGVIAKEGKVNLVNVQMEQESIIATNKIVIKEYRNPLVEFDNTTQGKALTSENIQALPTKNISAIAATSAGVSVNSDGDISIRGSRANATNYYIDGIRVNAASAGNLIPQAQIEQMQIITGGIEARYGDVTGGIISITTKGPSNKYTGGLELETSKYLDPYGYNLINGNVSGPLVKKKNGESILGFRVFGQYRNIEDDGPSAVGVYRASEELISELEAAPTTRFNGTAFPSAEFVGDRSTDDAARVNLLDARPNETDRDINISANIDARISKNIDISFSGAYFDSKNRFAPSRRWELYNWQNNPFNYINGYRGNIKIRHKLGNQNFSSEEGAEANDQIIRNASYSIQVGYEKSQDRTEDFRHTDNIFNYGYYGNQPRTWMPTASVLTDPDNWEGEIIELPNGQQLAHQGYLEISTPTEFMPDMAVNPVLAQMNPVNGFEEPVVNEVWDLFDNVGRVYNRFSKGEDDILTVNVNSGFDFMPGGSEKGKHNIQFGFLYEQRTNRNWEINPRRLWELMRLNVNRHLNGVDTNNVVGTFEQDGVTFTQYGPGVLSGDDANIQDNAFFQNVRNLTGQEIDDYVNIDGINPNDLSLSLFSPAELSNFNIIDYYGYDYLGDKTSTSSTFNDFFGRNAEGQRNFTVAPWTPIYGAGYIQDKFTYKDIIFRLGLRVDYYDANSKVLNDPYSLNRIQTAEEFFAANPDQQPPETVGDDYSVYVQGEGSNSVIGYRLGEQWFQPDGTATDGNRLFGGGLVFPAYTEQNPDARNPQNEGFNVDESFKDYEPQLNFMPRLAFSFPISEDAGFFAHYDILVQRPPSNIINTALGYYYFNSAARFSPTDDPANNPDLKPEKTIDYEIGFQQKISNSSAIKVSAYYKELRDMIQARFYQFVPTVTQYQTYGNIDFGTVKGFSFSYDMRRTGNFELNATYTLQFADGSGSGANSSSGFNPNASIRTLLPLSFDERHRFTAVADYRYGSGKSYNGPRIGNADIFSNAGINLLMTTVSGRPYSTFTNTTAPLTSTLRKNINGARLPWILSADIQIDKNFQFKLSEESQRYLGLNVYLRIQNVLDRDNIRGVYDVSGDPDSDGYLLSTFGEQRISQIEESNLSTESFLANYNWRILNPNNFSRPRQIFLGAIINF